MGGERAPSYLTSLSLSAAVQTVTGDVTPFYCLTTCRVDTWFPEQSELEIRIVLARCFFCFFLRTKQAAVFACISLREGKNRQSVTN